jgi:quercetin dioxygenase-like cupin family protein
MRDHHSSRILHHIAAGSGTTILDVAGLTVEFLTGLQDAPGDFCVMRGTIPPGAVVPIHSHDSTETFLVLSGTKQPLVPGEHGLEWKT